MILLVWLMLIPFPTDEPNFWKTQYTLSLIKAGVSQIIRKICQKLLKAKEWLD